MEVLLFYPITLMLLKKADYDDPDKSRQTEFKLLKVCKTHPLLHVSCGRRRKNLYVSAIPHFSLRESLNCNDGRQYNTDARAVAEQLVNDRASHSKRNRNYTKIMKHASCMMHCEKQDRGLSLFYN